jgi:hypothetical protein
VIARDSPRVTTRLSDPVPIWQDSKLTTWETGQREFHSEKFAWDSKIMVGLVVYAIGVLTFIIFLIGEWIYILVFKIDN